MIQTKITKDIYHGDGTTRRFEVTFDYNTKDNVKQIDLYTCTYTTEEGVTKYNNDVTKITSNYDFEVVNDVTYAVYPSDAAVSDGATPMASGTAIIIMRNTPNEQLSTGQYTSDKVEKQLDRLTMVQQELQEQLDRAYQAPEYVDKVNKADFATVANDIDAVNTVAAITEDIDLVNANAENITTVAQNIEDVNATGQNIEDVNIVALNINDVSTVAGIASDVTQVAGISTAVSNVSDNSSDVTLVSDNMASVMTTASSITDVQTVAGIATDVSTVADNNTNVTAVAGNATNINTVANKINKVETVADNISSVNTVSTNISDVTNVSDNMTTISEVSENMDDVIAAADAVEEVLPHITEINNVSDNINDIVTVASINSDVSTVATNSSDISSVADNATNINTVASNVSNISTAVSNMSAIIAAPTAATNAANSALNAAASATNAQKWAEGTDADVQPLGGTKSSKGWANRAQELVESIGTVMRYKGSVANYAALQAIQNPTLGDTYNVLDTGDNYSWDGTAWDKIGSVVDLSSYRTAAQQDVIDATYLPLSGGTMTGDVTWTGADSRVVGIQMTESGKNLDFGWKWSTYDGAGMYLRSTSFSEQPGTFGLYARNSNNTRHLIGQASGWLAWDGKEVQTAKHKGAVNGIASLNNKAKLLSYQLPTKATFDGYYETVGEPTLTDGIMSDFSTTDYAKSLCGFNPGSNPWISITKAKVNSFTDGGTIISGGAANTKSFQLGIKNGANAGKLVLYVSSDGTATDIVNNLMTTNPVIDINTWYWFAVLFTGSEYKVAISDDKTIWTTVISSSSSTPINQGVKNSYGYNSSQYPEPLDGEIDFNETCIQELNAYFIPPLGYPILPTDMKGADGVNAGMAGLVPVPAATDNTKFLKGDGTWANPTASSSAWGSITGDLEDQTDLQNELDSKAPAVLLSHFWSDHIINEMSYLRGDTFSWQSGDVYTAVYQHLVDDIDGKTAQTETIGNYTITYYEADDTHKICLADQETILYNLFNEYGAAGYYILDTTNTRFKFPRDSSGHGQLIEKMSSDADYCLVFEDGYCIQGGRVVSSANTRTTITFHKEFLNTNYDPKFTCLTYINDGYIMGFDNFTTTTMTVWNTMGQSPTIAWSAQGYVQAPANPYKEFKKYLYFYVGTFTKTAYQETAGLNSELFNGKVDLNLNNMNPSATAKETIVGWGMPDYSATLSSVGNNYTAPCDGIFWFSVRNYNTTLNVNITPLSSTEITYSQVINNYGSYGGYQILLGKGDKIVISNTTTTLAYSYFIPLKGVQNA